MLSSNYWENHINQGNIGNRDINTAASGIMVFRGQMVDDIHIIKTTLLV